MTWQDKVIAVGQLVLSIGLLPMIVAWVDVPALTSVPTAIVLFIFSLTFGTLRLRFSAFTSLLSALLWSFIYLQHLILNW